MKKTVAEILPAFGEYTLISPVDVREQNPLLTAYITSLCIDSRKATDRSLFFCLVGAHADGHMFATQAYRAGVRAFVVERLLELPRDALQIRVRNARTALADGAALFYDYPQRSLRMVGLTGTKGKTTTAHMIYSILNGCGIPAGYIGTNGITFAGLHFPTVNSTPESLDIYHYLRYMVDMGVKVCVMEVSSQALWMQRVRGLTFDCCVFTNLSHDHIGEVEHPDMSHYAACKHSLFTDYGAKLVVCHADDPATPYMVEGVTAPLVTFRIADKPAGTADLLPAGRVRSRWEAGQPTRENLDGLPGVAFPAMRDPDGQPFTAHLPLPGSFNVENALCALAVCREVFDIPVKEALPILAHIRIPGRFETYTFPALPDVTFVIDYAHNGVSLASVLDTLRTICRGRLICLFGSVGDRTTGRRQDLALAAAHRADLCILTSDNPGFEDPEHIIGEIDAAFPPDSCPRLLCPDRAKAIRQAVEMVMPGDVVLLAGKGHEDYQLVRGRQIPFSEKQILKQAVDQLKAAAVEN